MVYFLIGTNVLGNNANQTWQLIQKEVFKGGFGGPVCTGQQIETEIEKFRLGNVNTQLKYESQMQKLEGSMEGLLKKIERQYLDLKDLIKADFKIDSQDQKGYTIEQFLLKFKWQDKAFPRSQQLPDLIQTITKRMNLVDSLFKQNVQQYTEKKNIEQQLQVKEGNYYIIDLIDVIVPEIVSESDFKYSENITTLIAVVPKNKEQMFLEKYDRVTEQVIPGSAKKFKVQADKDGLNLYRVQLFTKELGKKPQDDDEEKKKLYRNPIENYVFQMREQLGVTIREFHYNARAFEQRKSARSQVQLDSKSLADVLEKSCKTSFSDLYNAYIHLKYLRLYADMACRFIKGDAIFAAILTSKQGKEPQVLQDLTNLFCEPNQRGLYGGKDELDTEEFYPFVYIPITMS